MKLSKYIFSTDRWTLKEIPFPHIFTQQFLSQKFFDVLKGAFPVDLCNQYSNRAVMGGRKFIGSDSDEFYQFLDGSPEWGHFWAQLNSEQGVRAFLEYFHDQLSPEIMLRLEGATFDESYQKKFDARIRRCMRLDGSVSVVSIVRRKFWSLLKKLDARFRSERLYVYMDFSTASDGYGREVHCDNPERITGSVVYFNDLEVGDTQGGEFVMHSRACCAKSGKIEFKIIDKVIPRENSAIVFLSSANSYHSVPVMSGFSRDRYFIYFGISSTRPVEIA